MKLDLNPRQCIRTRYLGPTNHRGARIKASADADSLIVDWDYALDPGPNHRLAAKMLIGKLEWKHDEILTGCYGNEYYHLLVLEIKE